MKNKLPKGWKTETLGGIAKYINGAAFKPADWSNSGLPIVRIQNLNGKKSYNYYDGKIADKYIIKNNDILISWSASLDVYRWNNGKALLNQHIFNTEIDEKKVRDDFFFYLIKFALDDIKSQVHGVGMQHITKGKFEKIEVPVPPLQEQQKIVKILDATLGKIDQAIALINQNIEKLEQLNASVLDEIFKGLKAPKLTWDDVLTIINGKNQRKVQNPNGKYPIYGSGGIMNYADDYLCPENTVIVGRKGTINNPLFIETKFWNVDTAFGICAGEKLNPKFLYYFCRNFNFKNLNKSTTLPSLAKRDLLKIKMIVPTLNKQKQIVKYLDHTTERNTQLIQHYENKLQSLQDLKKSVLDRAFKGKLKREVVMVEEAFSLPFYQMQLIGLSIQANKQDNIPQGEMAIAKDMYLLDRLYGVDTKMKFVNHSWGPFAPEIKKRITNKEYFGRKNFPNSQATYLDTVNEELLLGKVDTDLKQQVFKGIQDLNEKLFLKVTKYRRAEIKELLATVLKCIEDTQLTQLSTIREAMQNWKIKQGQYKTKAEKFMQSDTEKMLLFITKNEWEKKVLK